MERLTVVALFVLGALGAGCRAEGADPGALDSGARDSGALDPADAGPVVPDAGVATGCRRAAPAPAAAPWFVDVSAATGVGAPAGSGFGRATVVDLDGDGHDDVVFTPTHDGPHVVPADDFAKYVLRSRGDGTYADFTAESGLAGARLGLMVFGDVDDDGDQDMYGGVIEGQGLDDRGIWLNDGRGRLTRRAGDGTTLPTLPCGQATCTPAQIGATFFDLDGDLDLDLYVGSWFWSDGATQTRWQPPAADLVFMGAGDGTFRAAALPAGPRRATMGVSPGDFDDDGDLDLFVAGYGAGRPSLCSAPEGWDKDRLWQNQAGVLTDVAEALGVAATALGVGGRTSEPTLTIGDECPAPERGTFPGPIGSNSFTAQFADFDNDGDLDLISGAIAHPDYVQSDPTILFVNQGAPGFAFAPVRESVGLRYREDEKHPSFVDVDADGRLDLVITGFRDPRENELDVYAQRADHTFRRLTPAESGVDDRAQESVVWLDHDDDGDLDLLIAEEDAPPRLFENRAADANHVLVVELVGERPRDATGAKVTLMSSAGPQRRDVVSGNGHYNPQPSRRQYFGLGGDTCADALTVRWPSGAVETIGAVPADHRIVVRERGGHSLIPLARGR
jgi:hypothetical protein